MIVILSYSGDRVTNEVIDWLQAYGCNYKRINLEEEDYRKLSVIIKEGSSDIQLELKDGNNLKLSKVSFFFFRGGRLKGKFDGYHQEGLSQRLIQTQLISEFETLTNFFYREISKKCLGNPLFDSSNKLQQLKTAMECGLKIPVTLVGGSRKQLQLQNETSKPFLITKSIQENILLQDSEHVHFDLKVRLIQQSELPECFFPSLFQHPIEKKLEIRTFYLDGFFYSLAMLLCASDQEIIDYRTATDHIKYAMYQLPKIVEKKLDDFMKKMGLNTGSIDLIMDKQSNYYFLEVNPNGQLGWVSDYGNYFLEEKIARYLLKKDRNF